MSNFEKDSWVWITDEEERYLPAKVLTPFARGTATTVLTEDGEERKLSAAESANVQECNEEALNSNIDDLVNISDLNEMSILHNLRIRFKEDKIYTNISSILISVNPFKLLPLYTPEVLDSYRSGYRGKAPHVFGIAYNAFHDMLNENRDQSVVISGESGAGKSEATKLILQFLTDVSRSNATAGASQSLEQQILAANPILEALGNAKTLRNNNSSRFGKLITVNFDKNGSIIGGSIINYLLEKSRVVVQTQGERNYHIFYQLLSLASSNPKLSTELKLSDPELFTYTSQSGVIHIDGVSDEKDFEDVQNSFNILRFSATDQHEILKIVAGVLHFGNVKFKVQKKATEEDGCAIINSEIVAHAASLWGVDAALLEKFLCARNIGTRSIILVSYNLNQAQDARDAMVKRVYADLFQFVVDSINKELSASGVQRHRFIGVLDIFGFESFEVNSFEQLCINFCNEKLQFHFNEHIFKMEQTLYAQEGIVIPGSSFVDNQPTLDLLELKATGLFSMVDEEISVPKGNDDSLLSKILKNHTSHPNLIRPKAKDCKDFLKNFGVLHYAGPVFYNTTNFLEKNKDQLHPDIVNVLRLSTSAVMQKLFPPESEAPANSRQVGRAGAGKASVPQKKTLGTQFKIQLNELIATLNSTYPHFVRCMKSNDKKCGNIFASQRMQDQLRYAGLVEVCRIRKLGFPVRRPFDEFYKRYRCCDLLNSSNLEMLCQALEKEGVLKKGEWARGKSRIFMRTLQAQQLELAREKSLLKVTTIIQKHARRFIFRCRYLNILKNISNIQAAIKKRTEEDLVFVIDMSAELPFGGHHLKVVQVAKQLLLRIQEEKRVIKLLENAILSSDLNSLRSAVASHASVVPPFQTPLSDQANELIAKLEREAAVRAGLLAAVASRNINQLNEFIEKAKKMGVVSKELEQAISLKQRLDQETALLASLRDAIKAKHLEPLMKLISECVEIGLNGPEVQEAQQVKDKILSEQAEMRAAAESQRKADEAAAAKRVQMIDDAKKRLVEVRTCKDVNVINQAIQTAIQLGIDSPEVEETKRVLSRFQNIDDVRAQLMAAIQVLQVKSESGMVVADLEVLNRAIIKAEDVGESFAELDYAREAYKTFQSHIQVRTDLLAAVQSRERKALTAAIEAAENLDLMSNDLNKAKDVLKELENARRQQAASGVVTEDQQQPYDAAEEARKKRQEYAKQARFELKHYPGLRSPDDYARGLILNKSKVKEGFLLFQNSVIPRSLLDLTNKEANKLALQIHKDLLGYMGDKQMPFPAMLAQDILRKGYEYKPIRDEIYAQIIKQLSGNPRAESVAKGWQMMCMCVGTFPPSYEFENYLLHYILEKRDRGRGAIVDYARYCLRTLEAILSNGDGSGFVPSVEEISAYKDRPPILATIYLVDGNVITEDLPITPDLNVGKVIEMCTGWLDLRDQRINSLGMFVYDLGEIEDPKGGENPFANAPYKDLVRTPRPLRNEDFMGDIIVHKARQRRNFKFVFKKKIFLPSHRYRGEDPFYERLVYLQAEDEAIIQGNIDVNENSDVVELASISMVVAFGDGVGTSVDELLDNNVMDFVVPTWRDSKPTEEWAKLVLRRVDSLVAQDPDDLQQRFLEIVYKYPQYGSHWFFVHKIEPPPNQLVPDTIRRLPRDITLCFNSEGLTIYDSNRRFLCLYSFADIYRWGGSSSQFSLILADDSINDSFEFCVITAQAGDLAAIILDHVRAIMAEQKMG